MRQFVLAAALLAPLHLAHAQAVPPLTYSQPLPPAGVQAVQQRLQQQGAYAGRVDGLWGRDSQSALERYQRTHNLQPTGQLNQATAATLGIAPDQLAAVVGIPLALPTVVAVTPAQPPVATAGPAAAPLSRASVLTVQNRLRDLNYYPGVPDGVWGGDTQQAIERFQQGRGLQVNGQLNPATASALGLDPNAILLGR